LQAQRLLPSSHNHRRQALINLWRFCDGRRHTCPALDTDRYREGKPEPRAVDAALLDAVFAAMPTTRAKTHLLLIRWTAARPCEIASLSPERVILSGETPYIHYTTGKSGDDRVGPLNQHGLDAARLLVSLAAWGPVDRAAMSLALTP